MDDLEMLACANAGAEVLKIIATYGDKAAGEIFKGYVQAFAHGLRAVRPSGYESAEFLYRLADQHAVLPIVGVNNAADDQGNAPRGQKTKEGGNSRNDSRRT